MATPTKEEMRQEALTRLNILKLAPFVAMEFESKGKIYKSDVNAVIAALSEEEKQMVQEFEEKEGILVYHILYTDMGMYGHQYSFFCVSKYKQDWEDEHECLRIKSPVVYVKNSSYDDCSEFGTIGIDVHNGAILRLF